MLLTDSAKEELTRRANGLASSSRSPGAPVLNAKSSLEGVCRWLQWAGSYPLGTLVEAPSEWMIDVMVDTYQAEIKGSHGFGIRHPRARATADRLHDEAAAAGARLQQFPRRPNGLVPDEVKATSEYHTAKADYDRAFAAQRSFNAYYTKRFTREIKANRRR